METAFLKVEELTDAIKSYAEIRIASLKLNAAEKSSAVIANLFAGLAAAIVLVFFLLFASIAFSIFLNELTGKNWAGFTIVAGLYLFAGLLLWTSRGRIIRMPVMNAIIKQLFIDHDEQD